jgi:hypothetical protein
VLWVLPILVLATTAAVLVGDGQLGVALAPVLLALLVWGLWTLPLRVPMLVLLALAWMTGSAGGDFASGLVPNPLHMVGMLLWVKLNVVLPISALVFKGFDIIGLLLLVVIVQRHVRRSTLDRVGWVDTPRPLTLFAALSILALVFMSARGLATGGSFRFLLWQFIGWLYLPIVYVLMRQALRGPGDAVLVGATVLGAGAFRAVEAIVLRLMFPSEEVMSYATSHTDSVLFAVCLAILFAMVLEMPSPRSWKLAAVLAPLYLWGAVANNRRLVWMELLMVAIFFWVVTPWRPTKRKLARAMLYTAIPLMLYVAAGWNSGSRIFYPVQQIHSMIDAKRDASTLWRELENFNLIYTYGLSPIFGLGFGHPFVQRIWLPDVTSVYELEPYIPHNGFLGIWAFGGLVGFSLLWALFPVGMFFTVRAYRWSRTPWERVTALGAASVQIAYLLQGWGDLGFGNLGPVFTVAASYALVGKICTANGGWGPAHPATSSPQLRGERTATSEV